MSLAFEYLYRKGIVKKLATFPCSVFVEQNLKRIAFSIEQTNNGYSIKEWEICEACPYMALPLMKEQQVKSLEDLGNYFLNKNVLKFNLRSIPAFENSTRRPMSEEVYSSYFDNYLSYFESHNLRKEKWLLDVFLQIYEPQICSIELSIKRSIGLYGFYASKEILTEQKYILENCYQKSWKFWKLWVKHILLLNGTPGELSFGSF